MAAVNRPRAPLPRRVYWFRRLLVVGVAVALVFGIARLLEYGMGGSEDPAKATAVAGSPTSAPAVTPTPRKKKGKAGTGAAAQEQEKEKEKLAKPEGDCDDSDLLITPTISEAHAGSPVKIVLELTTSDEEACYWEVSPESVFVNIGSEEEGTLWSSQHCPDAIPTEQVVPRREHAARVTMWWDAKESDEECTAWTDWVLGGNYLATAAARGSVNPVTTGFVLGGAVAPTITATPTPTPGPRKGGGKGKKGGSSGDGSDT